MVVADPAPDQDETAFRILPKWTSLENLVLNLESLHLGLFYRLGLTSAWVAAAICLAAALCFIRFGFGSEALIGSVFAGVLIVLSKIDLETRLVPNRIVLPADGAHPRRAARGAPSTGASSSSSQPWASGLFLLIPLLVYPARTGLGDVKLAMLLGAGLGGAVITAFVVGFLAAFFVAVGILVTRGAEGREDRDSVRPVPSSRRARRASDREEEPLTDGEASAGGLSEQGARAPASRRASPPSATA